MDYALQVKKSLQEAGLRVELDERNEKIGYKIREAQVQKLPYMLIVGDKEAENNTISVRTREKGDIGQSSIEDFVKEVISETSKIIN